MEQTAKGETLQTKQNCVLALREDPLFGGAIRLNLLTGQKVILKDLGWKRLAGPITDEDLSQIYYYFEKFYGLKSEKLMKYQKSADNLQTKRKALLEKYLEGIVSQDIYEETDVGYERKLSDIRANIEMLEQQMEDEVSLKRRVEDFKKALSQNEVLQEFDRGIFESIIEKVIVGGYDEDGNKDPYKITFIYKTGFRNEVGNAKQRFDKTKSVGDKAKELCSHIADEVKDVCSYVSDNTC